MSTKSTVTSLEFISGACSVLALPAAFFTVAFGLYSMPNACGIGILITGALAGGYKLAELKSIELRKQMSGRDNYKAGI